MELTDLITEKPFCVTQQDDTVTTARALLGTILIHEAPHGLTAGRIVETEAYTWDDPASHSYRGLTNRCAAMFGDPGTAYVYQTRHHRCFNVVTNEPGIGEAVLIRALEPVAGLDLMRARRLTDDITKLTNGPANLVQAMGIRASHDGASLSDGELRLLNGTPVPDCDVIQTCRIGVNKAADYRRRFYVRNCPHVSRGSRSDATRLA